jgi:hypothetical protein
LFRHPLFLFFGSGTWQGQEDHVGIVIFWNIEANALVIIIKTKENSRLFGELYTMTEKSALSKALF